MLTQLGLDQHTETVYRAMLTRPGDGVSALADRLGLPEDVIRASLDQLSELALVRPSYDDPGRIRAVSPDVGMEILLARQQAELAAQQQRVEATRAAAAQLISEYAALRPDAAQPGVEHLAGLDQIRDRIATLTRDTKEEVMIFAPDGEQTKENLEASRPLDEALLERGVRMRTIYLDSVRNSPHSVEYAEWLSALGRQARTVPTLPLRMIISDRTTAIVPVNSENSAAGAVVLTGDGTLTALCALFESVWENGKPLGEKTRRDGDGPTDTELTALKLLADGHTDEAIAKRLGVSHRTARRIATTLMERLGARSRFEAGVRAVQQGWLT
ncbi:helix-turn-helix transcriptional regulator [Streptomyces antimicrobicus]|uniref:LuxR C-terminal-related transcriptional regulator n=1 Tax=Streptomyces antimicrobicus TaxID=2883108 RepID=A0ABS8B8V9_9ACTN|nr:LuxR family transcriptional regulator [Streptomyces antimicrobicus]MCB5181047.1 LuxR C-terminal-related transcriptional regulator [Streptomyces antimicrobicus]